MAISKKTRVAVYKKFDGHCAYCGRHIAYNNMQVDHFKPQRAWNPEDSGTDGIENLMPSCRMCNHYKRAHDLETFRRYIAEIPRKLQENYIYKVGVVYGNVLENPKAIKFYFEKVRDTPPGGDPMTKQQLVDEYAREHLCATCEWKNDNICTLPRCMKMEERSKNERKTAQPR